MFSLPFPVSVSFEKLRKVQGVAGARNGGNAELSDSTVCTDTVWTHPEERGLLSHSQLLIQETDRSNTVLTSLVCLTVE